MKPIFILGMGAQKAGTSWLHKMLSRQDNVNMGYRKEYHIWDYVYSDFFNGARIKETKPDNADYAMRRMMRNSSEIYIQYFQGLLNSDINVTGDITPTYSIINAQGLEKISSIIKGSGFDIKVIFLMRDPIDRIWSSVRMLKRVLSAKGQNLPEDFCNRRISEYLRNKNKFKAHISRSDYKTTVQNITKVFSEDEVYFEFYENLFNEKSIYRLQDFLGFPLKNFDFSMRINASDQEMLSEENTQLLTQFLAPQYDFCNEVFERHKGLWRDIS